MHKTFISYHHDRDQQYKDDLAKPAGNAGCSEGMSLNRQRILHHASKSHYGVQTADYCCWTIFRKRERGDASYYSRIKKAVRSEFAIFENGKTLYY